ncbi:MAG: hypothetical protein LBJ10_03600 [Clostridiales bacterium]|jgi:hypothetical protein|nr:hypothetical protein [Clostridiales bacterium]
MNSMLDAVLLPKAFYRTMPVSRRTLIFCICVSGAFSFGYPFLPDNFSALFVGQPAGIALFNAALTIALLLLTGIVDSFVYCRPISDALRYLSGKLGGYRDSFLLLKTMKIYALSAVIVNPLYILVSRALFGDIETTRNIGKIQVYLLATALMQLWSFGIMSRGMNSVLRFKGVQRVAVFLFVSSWSFIWGIVLRYMVAEFLLKLYIYTAALVI